MTNVAMNATSLQSQIRHYSQVEGDGAAQDVSNDNNESAQLDNGFDWEAMGLYAVQDDQSERLKTWTTYQYPLEHNLSASTAITDSQPLPLSKKRKRQDSDVCKNRQVIEKPFNIPNAKRTRRDTSHSTATDTAHHVTSDLLENNIATGNVEFEEVRSLLSRSNPILPNPSDRVVNLSEPNPYADEELSEHPRITSKSDPVILPKETWVDGTICANGLVKFRLQFNRDKVSQTAKDILAKYRSSNDSSRNEPSIVGDVSYLPPDFGRGLRLDEMDMRLFKFYIKAYCPGRTLLDQSNVWLHGVPAIAEKSDCVKHAMLSVSAGYVLDYAPSVKLKRRANHHHKRASLLLGLELNKPENYAIGNEEPLLMALSLLNHEDIVNWETRESTKKNPRWYQGEKLIKTLLDKSDPGYRFRHPENVQSSMNRYVMSHYRMKSLILSDTCAPLEDEYDENAYSWLLEGNEKEVRRITGLAGCCAKLLHVYAQITRLCAQALHIQQAPVVYAAGKIILERLSNFQQWADTMETPFASPEHLFTACESDLDEDGKVQTAALSVALNAESHVQAAKIYLLCRLFRKPREHPSVQEALQSLLECTNYVPLDGPLYTAQDSLYGLAMAGLVAVSDEDRAVVRGQFAPLEMGPRGNDTPVWRMLEQLWRWFDQKPLSDLDDDKPIAEKDPWWENMVSYIYEQEGRLSLL